jgi:hypothetical protein
MRVEVNEKLSENEKIGAFFGYPGLLFTVESVHRRFYPGSTLRKILNMFIVLGLLSVVGIARILHII